MKSILNGVTVYAGDKNTHNISRESIDLDSDSNFAAEMFPGGTLRG